MGPTCTCPCRRPVPGGGGGLGQVQRGHERLLHGALPGAGLERPDPPAADQPHGPEQQRPRQPHQQCLPAGQVRAPLLSHLHFHLGQLTDALIQINVQRFIHTRLLTDGGATDPGTLCRVCR